MLVWNHLVSQVDDSPGLVEEIGTETEGDVPVPTWPAACPELEDIHVDVIHFQFASHVSS